MTWIVTIIGVLGDSGKKSCLLRGSASQVRISPVFEEVFNNFWLGLVIVDRLLKSALTNRHYVWVSSMLYKLQATERRPPSRTKRQHIRRRIECVPAAYVPFSSSILQETQEIDVTSSPSKSYGTRVNVGSDADQHLRDKDIANINARLGSYHCLLLSTLSLPKTVTKIVPVLLLLWTTALRAKISKPRAGHVTVEHRRISRLQRVIRRVFQNIQYPAAFFLGEVVVGIGFASGLAVKNDL